MPMINTQLVIGNTGNIFTLANFFSYTPLHNFIASAIIAPSADEPGPRKGRDVFAFLERNKENRHEETDDCARLRGLVRRDGAADSV